RQLRRGGKTVPGGTSERSELFGRRRTPESCTGPPGDGRHSRRRRYFRAVRRCARCAPRCVSRVSEGAMEISDRTAPRSYRHAERGGGPVAAIPGADRHLGTATGRAVGCGSRGQGGSRRARRAPGAGGGSRVHEPAAGNAIGSVHIAVCSAPVLPARPEFRSPGQKRAGGGELSVVPEVVGCGRGDVG